MNNKVIGKFFRLSLEENRKLKDLSIRSKLSETEVIRTLLDNVTLKEPPPKEFYTELNNLNKLRNTLQYLLHLTETTGTIYEYELNRCLTRIDHLIKQIKKKYL